MPWRREISSAERLLETDIRSREEIGMQARGFVGVMVVIVAAV